MALGKASQLQLADGGFEKREELERRETPRLEFIPLIGDFALALKLTLGKLP